MAPVSKKQRYSGPDRDGMEHITTVICHFFIAEIFSDSVHRTQICYSKIFLIWINSTACARTHTRDASRMSIRYSMLPGPRGALGLLPV